MKTFRIWVHVLPASLIALLIAPPATADQVILDDLIVNGSECVGFDCVNGQEFGFCTEVLRENNLRLFFDDTSTTAMFPKNDWEIIANDSANGGASYLGFADRGPGLMNFCGEGTCHGGTNDGLPCGLGGCEGVCVGTGFPEVPCLIDAQCDYSSLPGGFVGTCEGAGTCVSPGAIIFRIEAGGPEDSLVVDSAGDVNIQGNLTVGGTINGDAFAIAQLQEDVLALQAEVEAIKILLADDSDSDDSDSGDSDSADSDSADSDS